MTHCALLQKMVRLRAEGVLIELSLLEWDVLGVKCVKVSWFSDNMESLVVTVKE